MATKRKSTATRTSSMKRLKGDLRAHRTKKVSKKPTSSKLRGKLNAEGIKQMYYGPATEAKRKKMVTKHFDKHVKAQQKHKHHVLKLIGKTAEYVGLAAGGALALASGVGVVGLAADAALEAFVTSEAWQGAVAAASTITEGGTPFADALLAQSQAVVELNEPIDMVAAGVEDAAEEAGIAANDTVDGNVNRMQNVMRSSRGKKPVRSPMTLRSGRTTLRSGRTFANLHPGLP